VSNLVENFFSIYKAYLKRHSEDMAHDWEAVHLAALGAVSRNNGIKYFRRCGIPGAKNVLTSNEINDSEKEALSKEAELLEYAMILDL